MPELDVPVVGTPIEVGTFGSPVVYRVISRYASAAARDAANPAPASGDPAYLQDSLELQVHNGTVWESYQKVEALDTELVYVTLGDFEMKGNFLYTSHPSGAVTCAIGIRFEALNPNDVATLPGAIPAAFAPATHPLYVQLTRADGSASDNTPSCRFNPDGSVTVIPSGSATSQGDALGFVTWVIGADGTAAPAL